MAIYQKVNGVWTQVQRPYVKRGGVWTACTDAYVKRSGTWTRAYEYDVTPPNPPEITLSVVDDYDWVNGVKTLKTRYLNVGVRLPGSSNDPDARLTRVLSKYAGAPPTTQFGGTWTATADKTYPSEPWSEWRYNAYGPHKDTSLYAYKQWPLNAVAGTKLPADTDFWFTGWSLDANGNWSVATPAHIKTAKAGVEMRNIILKEASFQPNTSGSWRSTGFQSGKLVQQNSPRSVGLWFYGNQIVDSVGAQTTTGEAIVIRSATLFIRREDDIGAANANVYLFWNGYAAPGNLPAAGSSIVKTEITKLGTLAKGQGKWFELPTAFKNNLNTQLKCMGLDYKDYLKASAFPEDYSSVVSTAENLRCGELHVVWEEQL